MAAMVCHSLQSCLEFQLVDSRTERFGFPSSKPHSPQQNPIDLPFKTSFWDSNSKTQPEGRHNETEMSTGWSFLQVLSNVSSGSKEPTDKESVYVHPQEKRSSIPMSEKSLELCTEKLGNETGSDIVENNGYDMELLCLSPTREQARPRPGCLGGRKAKTQNFPPPLTTIRGSESLRVRSHREDGKLVMEAIRVPPSVSCFQAERSHGRLRLSFLKNHNFEQEETEPHDINEGVEEECESESEDDERIEETEGAEEDKELEEKEEEEEEEEEEEGGEEGGDEEGEEEETEEERKKYERPRRCKEGRQHENNELLINWEPLWVAIS